MKLQLLLIVGALVSAQFLGGCLTVQPWQRGVLAGEDMSLEEDALIDSLNDHIYFSKEATSGGRGTSGGGCGCN